jgi:sec-independent protein translocase protein TatA
MGIENPVHLLFLGAVALLVLGPKRLPELAKALGNGIREFRESIALGEDEEKPASPNGTATQPAAAANGAPPVAPQPPAAEGGTTAPPAPPSED